jgi:UDPglucose--hexose-1-phosphate uridylyltransferase
MSLGSHRRLNLLTGEWVLVSPHRLARPWLGAEAPVAAAPALAHDPGCTLCPGNTRAAGAVNPRYDGPFVFDNDFPALRAGDAAPSHPLLRAEAECGVCRVLCYAPEHHLSMSQLAAPRIRAVIDVWAQQYEELSARDDIAAVTIFENRGESMGASNPHPHGQIWATSSIPDELAREDEHQRAHLAAGGGPLLMDYLAHERADGARIVCETPHWTALCPWWAVWPFETLVLPHRAAGALPDFDPAERDSLAALLADLTARYDALFGVPFPYSMGWHQRPARAGAAPHFVAHAHFYPPLLRSATVRKFMVGFEMLAMPQRDFTPEEAAARLRASMPA